MEEHKVHPIPFRSDAQTLLTGNKGEVVAQFQQELFETLNERILELGFRVLVLQVQELKNERITYMRVRR